MPVVLPVGCLVLHHHEGLRVLLADFVRAPVHRAVVFEIVILGDVGQIMDPARSIGLCLVFQRFLQLHHGPIDDTDVVNALLVAMNGRLWEDIVEIRELLALVCRQHGSLSSAGHLVQELPHRLVDGGAALVLERLGEGLPREDVGELEEVVVLLVVAIEAEVREVCLEPVARRRGVGFPLRFGGRRQRLGRHARRKSLLAFL